MAKFPDNLDKVPLTVPPSEKEKVNELKPTEKKKSKKPYSDLIERRIQSYDLFQDYIGLQFVHLLDYYEDGQRRLIESKDETAYIASYKKTREDNEDITFMSYDLHINWIDSPLFNGSVEKFIETFSGLGNSEIGSRLKIIQEFKKQFLKFFKVDAEITAGDVPQFLGKTGAKSYYLKDLSGLNNLVESSAPDKPKQFVAYNADVIGLKLYEDVSQSMGYLASLYKSLSWSRINGKQVIPENLLRFDCEIRVQEMRKLRRFVKDVQTSEFDVFADKISNYVYKLYECQFFFATLPHGDSIDNTAPKEITDYDIKFNYKFSTMRFNKLTVDPNNLNKKVEFPIDNSLIDLNQIKSSQTSNSQVTEGTNPTIINAPNTYDLKPISSVKNGIISGSPSKTGTLQNIKNAGENVEQKPINLLNNALLRDANNLLNGQLRSSSPSLRNIQNVLLNRGKAKLQREITKQASLLNRTLGNIRFR